MEGILCATHHVYLQTGQVVLYVEAEAVSGASGVRYDHQQEPGADSDECGAISAGCCLQSRAIICGAVQGGKSGFYQGDGTGRRAVPRKD